MFFIVSQFAQVIYSIVFCILLLLMDAVNNYLGGFSTKTLQSALTVGDKNFYEIIYNDLFLPLAIAILIINVSWHLIKTICTEDDNDAEEPIMLVFNTFIGTGLILLCDDIMNFLLDFFQKAFDYAQLLFNVNPLDFCKIDFDGFVSKVNDGTILGEIGEGALNEAVTAGLVASFGAVVPTIMIIVDIFLFIQLLKILSMYVQRYIYMGFLLWTYPLAFGAFPCRSTKDITSNYTRAIISSFFSYLLSSIYLFIFMIVLSRAVMWDAKVSIFTNLFAIMLVKGVGEFFLQLDAFLDRIGLTNANRYRPSNMLDMAMGRVLGGYIQDSFGGFGDGEKEGSGLLGNIQKLDSNLSDAVGFNKFTGSLANKIDSLGNMFAGKSFSNESQNANTEEMANAFQGADDFQNAFSSLDENTSSEMLDGLSNDMNNAFDQGINGQAFDDLSNNDNMASFNDQLQSMFNTNDEVFGTITGADGEQENAIFRSDGNGGFKASVGSGDNKVEYDQDALQNLGASASLGIKSGMKDFNVSGISSDGIHKNLNCTMTNDNGNTVNAIGRMCEANEVGLNPSASYSSYQTSDGVMRYMEFTPEPEVHIGNGGEPTYPDPTTYFNNLENEQDYYNNLGGLI